ncbi:MAG: YkgJ family cysteine cluster protein [Deltaproteobacteria bacterium]|nr:YkgJ family cysteine cluster protein [Deltaproteobacteria bacterium]
MTAFVCQRCGSCCHGAGGVYLDRAGLERVAALLALSPEETARRFTRDEGGGIYAVLNSPARGGPCLFWEGGLCAIHEAKPPICAAWPYFWAVLASEEGFREAQSACPGLGRASYAAFKDSFARTGRPFPPRSFRPRAGVAATSPSLGLGPAPDPGPDPGRAAVAPTGARDGGTKAEKSAKKLLTGDAKEAN